MANVDRVRSVVQQGKPQHLIHVYGPTENTTFSTWYEIQDIPESATTIPIGQAVANTQVYLLDENLNPVPANVSGEIYLGGDGLARGYLNRPELTAERFLRIECSGAKTELEESLFSVLSPQSSVLYRTGDRALYRSDGNLEFLGRTDHQIKIRGFRVELGEIETVLAQHPAVQTAVVTVRGIDSGKLPGETPDDRQLIAYVIPEASAIPTERELRSFLKRSLPAYMLPAAFVLMETLPLTTNGKVDQKALPPPDQSVVSENVSVVAPTTSLEESLVQLWTQLLGRNQVGIHDNFFELGGHSLLATQLISRIRDRFQIALPLRSVFENPTIAELATTMEPLQKKASWTVPILQVSRQESGSQRREEVEL